MPSQVLTFASDEAWSEWRRLFARAGGLSASVASKEACAYAGKKSRAELEQERDEARQEAAGLRPPFEGNRKTRRGLALEPFLVREYLIDNPDRGAEMAAGKIIWLHESGKLAATPDAWTWELANPTVRWPLQLKDWSVGCASWFRDGATPVQLVHQCAVEAHCTESDRETCYVMIGGDVCHTRDLDIAPESLPGLLALADSFAAAVRALLESAAPVPA